MAATRRCRRQSASLAKKRTSTTAPLPSRTAEHCKQNVHCLRTRRVRPTHAQQRRRRLQLLT